MQHPLEFLDSPTEDNLRALYTTMEWGGRRGEGGWYQELFPFDVRTSDAHDLAGYMLGWLPHTILRFYAMLEGHEGEEEEEVEEPQTVHRALLLLTQRYLSLARRAEDSVTSPLRSREEWDGNEHLPPGIMSCIRRWHALRERSAKAWSEIDAVAYVGDFFAAEEGGHVWVRTIIRAAESMTERVWKEWAEGDVWTYTCPTPAIQEGDVCTEVMLCRPEQTPLFNMSLLECIMVTPLPLAMGHMWPSSDLEWLGTLKMPRGQRGMLREFLAVKGALSAELHFNYLLGSTAHPLLRLRYNDLPQEEEEEEEEEGHEETNMVTVEAKIDRIAAAYRAALPSSSPVPDVSLMEGDPGKVLFFSRNAAGVEVEVVYRGSSMRGAVRGESGKVTWSSKRIPHALIPSGLAALTRPRRSAGHVDSMLELEEIARTVSDEERRRAFLSDLHGHMRRPRLARNHFRRDVVLTVPGFLEMLVAKSDG